MLDTDAEKLQRMVKDAIQWVVPKGDWMEKDAEKFSKEDARRNPVTARKCCRQCIFLNPNDTCENFQSTKGLPKREQGEWIPISRELSESIYCEAWTEAALAKLLMLGYGPSGIAYARRHPKVDTPHDGLKDFTRYLSSLSRQASSSQQSIVSHGEDIGWPTMNERLKTVLLNVERYDNREMWPEYGKVAHSLGCIYYVISMLHLLSRNPNSRIAGFFDYMIETDGYSYRYEFGAAKELGPRAYELIVRTLEHPSKVPQNIAAKLLQTIAKYSYSEKSPEGSTDPNVWREWGKTEFRYDWGKD
jgi:hypothetical protein